MPIVPIVPIVCRPYTAPMDAPISSWESRIAALWQDIEAHQPAAFVALIDQLAGELPAGDPIASFERGCAQDSTGHPDLAVPLYQAALAAGLSGLRRRRAVIQMSSSVRNLGNPALAADWLKAESARTSDELDTAVQAFLALALVDLGREREAAAISLVALARHLPRYNRSLARYAGAIAETRLLSSPDHLG